MGHQLAVTMYPDFVFTGPLWKLTCQTPNELSRASVYLDIFVFMLFLTKSNWKYLLGQSSERKRLSFNLYESITRSADRNFVSLCHGRLIIK